MTRPTFSSSTARPRDDALGFYLACSDRDLLNKVEALMAKTGAVGLRDALGRVHYVIDGRKGSPYAVRRIGEVVHLVSSQCKANDEGEAAMTVEAIDYVLMGYRFMRALRGYRYLRFMLTQTFHDPSLLHPISKRLYPETARHFRVASSQVERNVRYVLDRLAEDGGLRPSMRRPLCSEGGRRLSVTAAVLTLHDQVQSAYAQLQSEQNDTPVH